MLAAVGNPILMRELRSRMRGRRALWIELLYVTILGVVVVTAYVAARESSMVFHTGWLGRTLFNSLSIAQGALLAFCAPALAAAALTGEREQQTFESLLVSPLRTAAIVRGKMVAATLFLSLLLTLSVPLLAVCFLFGGVSPHELVGTWAVQMANALLLAAVGLGWSAVCRSSIASTLMTYLTVGGYVLFASIYSSAASDGWLGAAVSPLTIGLVAAEPVTIGGWHTVQWIPSALMVLIATAWVLDATLCYLRHERDARLSGRPRLWLVAATLAGTGWLHSSLLASATHRTAVPGYTPTTAGVVAGALMVFALLGGLAAALLLCPADDNGRRRLPWWRIDRNDPASSVLFVVGLPALVASYWALAARPPAATPEVRLAGLAGLALVALCLLTAAVLLRRLSQWTGSRWAGVAVGGFLCAVGLIGGVMVTNAAAYEHGSSLLAPFAVFSPFSYVAKLDMWRDSLPRLRETLLAAGALQLIAVVPLAWPWRRRSVEA